MPGENALQPRSFMPEDSNPALPLDGRKWYVMQTRPHHESKAVAHLGLRTTAVEIFQPKIEVVRRRARQRYVCLEPLFPGYSFLRMHLTPETWQAVRWTPGVRRILGDEEGPIEVSDQFVETIAERVKPLGFVRVGVSFERGAKVRVKTGPFEGLEGIFERPASRKERVCVLLEILGSVVRGEIDPLDLERA